MDQQAIGRLIAQERKARALTQQQLADRLGVTNKAVSKWELGRSMPDVALFEPLCGELDLSIAELLSGHRIAAEEQQDAAEHLLMESISTRKLVGLSLFLQINSVIASLLLIGPLMLFPLQQPYRSVLVAFGLIEAVLVVYFDCTLPGKEARRSSLLVRAVYAVCLFATLAVLNFPAAVREGIPLPRVGLFFGGACLLSILLSAGVRFLYK